MEFILLTISFCVSFGCSKQDSLETEIFYANDIIVNVSHDSITSQTANYPHRHVSEDRVDDIAPKNDQTPQSISSSSTQIYIIVVIGIIPAAICAIVYSFSKVRKQCQNASPEEESSSTTISINSRNQHEVREFRYSYKHSEQDDIIENAGKSVTYAGSDSLFVRKRRVYSIEYPRKNLELQTVLGEGNFGLVWKAKVTSLNESKLVAVKTAKADSDENDWDDLLKELNIMLQLGQHPNVVRLLGCCTEKVPYYVIMEFVEKGKLLTILREYRKQKDYYNESDTYVTTSDLLSFAFNCAKGMEFVSSYGIIHRDLAARNILVDRENCCKIADFGLARSIRDKDEDVYEQKTKGAMPIRWMAPESLNLNLFTTKTDVWSFGVLLWEIVTLGSTPYPGLSATEVIKSVRDGYTMERPEVICCTNACYTLMKECWDINPKKRPTFSDIKRRLFNLIERRKDYIDFTNFADNYCYGIIYKSHGEKV